MIISLIVGLTLAAGALAYVMLPLLVGSAGGDASGPGDTADGGSRHGSPAGEELGAGAINVLREIEFDRATGKLSEADYGALKATYTDRALAEMRDAAVRGRSEMGPRPANVLGLSIAPLAADSHVASTSLPGACPACGPRPEPDARYCSNCARFLAAACGACGAPVTQPAARHCSDCGCRLAA